MSTYIFDNAAQQASQRFASLETLYDPWTIRHLEASRGDRYHRTQRTLVQSSLRRPTDCPSPRMRPSRIGLVLACADRIPDGAGTVSPGK